MPLLDAYAPVVAVAAAMLLVSYLIGSIPFAYIIVRLVRVRTSPRTGPAISAR
jgi:glycerol-3-phosphate acyltransferase PlsY